MRTDAAETAAAALLHEPLTPNLPSGKNPA
jgi:hypothetical protein